MEGQRLLAEKLEAGPIRRLAVLSRWMAAMDVNDALVQLLEESLEDLRDILLRLKASRGAQAAGGVYWHAAWEEEPHCVDPREAAVSDEIASLDTVEMDTQALARAKALGTAHVRGGTSGQASLPPGLLPGDGPMPDEVGVARPLRDPRRSTRGSGTLVRKPYGEHGTRGSGRVDGSSGSDGRYLRGSDPGAPIPPSRAGGMGRPQQEEPDREFQSLLENALAELLAS